MLATRMSAADAALAAIGFSLARLGETASGTFAALVLNFTATCGAFHLFAIVSTSR
jgi:hypothetical protein